jgi:uncharacterized protein (DUF58 family)
MGFVRAVTPFGWFVFALLFVGVSVGGLFSWVEAWIIAIAAAVLLLIAAPFLLGARAYDLSISLAQRSVVVGSQLEIMVTVANTSSRPQLATAAELVVGLAIRRLTVPMLGPRQTAEITVSVATGHRGVIQVGPLTLARRDPLGLLRREVVWPVRHRVYVYPRTAMLPPNSAGLVRDLEGQASRRLSDADLSFFAVREYVPGDEVRHIHWKATAKAGTLMVRQYEETQSARIAVLFDALPDEYANDDEFELGVSVAASISAQAAREGRDRYVVASRGNDPLSSYRRRADKAGPQRGQGFIELPSHDLTQLLDSWAELTLAYDAARFESLARGIAEGHRSLSIVAIVTGSIPTLERIQRAVLAFPPETQVLAIKCEHLADPHLMRVDPLTQCTVGMLSDLPGLLLRGLR